MRLILMSHLPRWSTRRPCRGDVALHEKGISEAKGRAGFVERVSWSGFRGAGLVERHSRGIVTNSAPLFTVVI